MLIVTTAGRTNEQMIQQAQEIASELNSLFVNRNKRSVLGLQEKYRADCLVVGKERLEFFSETERKPFFFHPNISVIRIKQIIQGKKDPFVIATNLTEGKTFLDCTLGLASDSIVASFIVGENGKVTGLEGSQSISYLVKNGLKNWKSGVFEIDEAMSRVEVIHAQSLGFLKSLKDNSFDCVYFDPMFDEQIIESDGIKSLRSLAIYEDLSDQLISQAYRVAKESVVLKDHFRSDRFEKYGFHVIRRKSAKFHFGILKKA